MTVITAGIVDTPAARAYLQPHELQFSQILII